LCVFAVVLHAGAAAARHGALLLRELKVEEAHAAYERASRLDPWCPKIRMAKANLAELLYRATQDVRHLVEARREMETAIALEPNHPNHRALYAAFALRYGGGDVAVREIERALELQPFEAKRYEQVAEIHFLLGRHYLGRGEADVARAHLERSAAVRALMAAQAEKVPDYVPEHRALPRLTPAVALHVGQSLALLGRLDEAEELLDFARTEGRSDLGRETDETARTRRAEAALWLGVLAEVRGDAAAAALLYEEARPVVIAPEALAEQIRPLIGKAAGP
jgi:tetratricopeptide (TPR) repeat protein